MEYKNSRISPHAGGVACLAQRFFCHYGCKGKGSVLGHACSGFSEKAYRCSAVPEEAQWFAGSGGAKMGRCVRQVVAVLATAAFACPFCRFQRRCYRWFRTVMTVWPVRRRYKRVMRCAERPAAWFTSGVLPHNI
ncbi:hypothetical protein NPIL_659661 [Nephila pilipes]|uniref:Uncharacterized protein n=1 Tax=Nephila pilipes TaxID=299642 RepID=A0A8X6PRP5_NEPPI|nr:hypothetical protein NPIL_659661 [Nephila pilipes]